jgi:hypothetical protein
VPNKDGTPAGIAVGTGAVALVGATLLASLLPGAGPRLAVLVVTVAGNAFGADDAPAALTIAALAWPLGNGFLLNRMGTLSWHAGIDVRYLLALSAAAAVGTAAARILGRAAAARTMRPFRDLLAEAPADPRHTRQRHTGQRRARQRRARQGQEGVVRG